MSAAIDIPAIEAATLAAWPALDTVTDGAWRARFAKGHTKRANSIICTDPEDGADPARRLDRLAALYRARGLDPIVRVTPLTAPALVDHLDAEGWTRFETSDTLVLPEIAEAAAGDVLVHAPTSGPWLESQAHLQDYDARTRAVLGEIVARLTDPAFGLVLAEQDRPVASGLFVIVEGTAVALNIVTARAERRKGHGRALMRAGLALCARHGAIAAAIQVVADNGPALALYRGLGFVPVFSYHYRRPPAGEPMQ